MGDFAGINIPRRIGGEKLHAALSTSVFLIVGNERIDTAGLGIADADRAIPAEIMFGARHAVGDIDRVVLVDIDRAGAAELFPFGQEISLAIENLNSVVLAVGNEESPFRIDGDVMRIVEEARRRARRVGSPAP